MRALLIVSFLFLNHHLFAQQDRARTQFQEYSTGVGSFIQEIPVTKQNIQGEMFVYEDFVTAAIITKKDEKVERVPLRYNAMDHQVEVKIDNEIKRLDSDKIKSFHLLDRPSERFIHVSEVTPVVPHDKGFLKVIADYGDSMLLKRYFVKIAKANYNIALSTGNKYDTANLKEDYYIIHENEEVVNFSGSKKEIKNIWPDHSSELLSFVKKEKIKFKSEENFAKFFAYLMSIQ